MSPYKASQTTCWLAVFAIPHDEMGQRVKG
jgi:hypothetical protein